MIQQIYKKWERDFAAEEIVDILEEDEEVIYRIYEAIEEVRVADVDKIYEQFKAKSYKEIN